MSERPPQRRILPPLPGLFGAVFAFIVLVLVAILNTWASLDARANNTISAWVTHGGRFYAAIPYFIGATAGHWCSRGIELPEPPGGPLLVLLVCAVLLIVDFKTGGLLARRYPFWLCLLLGLGHGAILWPMREVAT